MTHFSCSRYIRVGLRAIAVATFGGAVFAGMTSVTFAGDGSDATGGDVHGGDAQGSDSDDDKAVAMKSRFAEMVSRISIAPAGNPQSLFKLLPRPALSWSNPARRTTAGGLFLWTSEGRPQVALCVYPDGEQVIDLEFQSLSDGPLSADSDDRLLWQPSEGGVNWLPVDGGQPPARSLPARLRQMRMIARQFSAKLVPPNKNPIELRLLETPVYRYELSDDVAAKIGSAATDLIDGAMFAFVQGTDPEVLLIVEAYEDNDQQKWRYALARMSIVPTQVHHQSNLVWETQWAVKRINTPYYVYKSF